VILVVTAAGLGLLGLPAAMRRVGRQLVPRHWALLCAVALLSGTVLVITTILIIAAPRALEFVGLPAAARACEHMLGGLYPGGTVVWFSAMALGLSAAVLGTKAVVHAHRSVRRASIGSAAGTGMGRRGRFDIILMPDERTCAVSVPNGRRGGRVLLSRGLVDTLSSSELDAVCAHEMAHLRFSHQRYLVLAVLVEEAFWFWPPATRSTSALRLALERWADESAAGDSSDIRQRLRSALLTVATVAPSPTLAAFSAMDGLMERLHALDAQPGRTRLWAWLVLFAPGLLVGIAIAYATTRIGHQAYCFITMPGRCGSP